MEPNKEWLNLLDQKKDFLQAPIDLDKYFSQDEVAGYALNVVEMGEFTSTSGKLVAVDPLGFVITEESEAFFENAPVGIFKTYASFITLDHPEEEEKAHLIASYKIQFSDEKPTHYREALRGNEDLASLQEDEYFGFNTDSGLAAIFDQDAFPQITAQIDKIENKSEEANLYDDYFEALFKENLKANPEMQSEEGDWINWSVPESNYHFPIFQAGFGEGVYPVYFGYNDKNEIVALYVHFIDAEMEIDEDEEFLD
ncbi:DUF4241 domain-containing protein [Vaginella massiliensis]|uniref:DUF4241 domain-containing protein n=1 Tax=Vaginella massiliensis TaxID=1816680 RepID=UPI003750C209